MIKISCISRITIIFFYWLTFNNSASAILISFENKDYAGKIFNFYSYSDPVSLKQLSFLTIQLDESGIFRGNVEISKPTYLFCDFGIYRGMLILEPEANIELKLPPLREKTFADRKNPYFEPVLFWFTTGEKTDLTSLLSNFEIEFYQLTNRYFDQLYFRRSQAYIDSVKVKIDEKFNGTSKEIFNIYKLLKFKSLESDVYRYEAGDISKTFMEINPEYWNQPSFIELFEKIYNNKLVFDAKDIKGEKLLLAVKEENLNFLLNHFKTNYNLKGDFLYLSLIKGLHDGFYSGDFSKEGILNMLKSEILTSHSNKLIRTAAKNVIGKLAFLGPDFNAPVICLESLEGTKQCSDNKTGKFKYIIFADTEMLVCKEHLKYLTKIDEKFNKYLEIIIVLRNTEQEELKSFIKNFIIPGLKLLDKNEEYIQKYKIRSFPQCFLLNQNHRVEFIGVKAPLDGFELQFGKFLQQELIETIRNQSR